MRLPILSLLTFLVILPGLAQAQVAPDLNGSLSPTTISLGPNETAELRWQLTNAGVGSGSVAATIMSQPVGWILELSTQSFSLNGGQSQTITVSIRPDPAVAAPQNGTAKLQAIIRDASGQFNDASQSDVQVAYVAPAVAPPPPPPDRTLLYVGLVTLAIAIIGTAAYVVQARRVGLVAPEGVQRLTIGTDGQYHLTVTNKAGIPQDVEVRVRGVPAYWGAAVSYPVLHLARGETTALPLVIKVPASETPNQRRTLVLQARPNRFSPWLVKDHIDLDLIDIAKIEAPSTPTA